MINTLFRYGISYNGVPICGLSTSGKPIFTPIYDGRLPSMIFNDYNSAQNNLIFLIECTLTNYYEDIDVTRFSITTYSITEQHEMGVLGYDALFEIYTSAGKTISKLTHLCVLKGFRKILPKNYKKMIEDPDFKDNFEKNVPFFVQQNIERFMDVGINTCTPDEISAIILTSTDELLEAIRIDTLNNVSK